jgi:hypothetical protein
MYLGCSTELRLNAFQILPSFGAFKAGAVLHRPNVGIIQGGAVERRPPNTVYF